MTERLFHYRDAKSDKFWRITLDGASHTVQFGRSGTTGQAQRKEFSSDAEARTSYEKLIAEKMRKGYTEAAEGSSAAPPAAVRILEKTADDTSTTTSVERESIPDPETPATAAIAETTPDIPASTEVPPSRIDLDPQDWRVATWRPFAPQSRQPAPSFDREEALKRLEKIPALSYRGCRWGDARIAHALSRGEALFWLRAILSENSHSGAKLAAEFRATPEWRDEISVEEIAAEMSPSICGYVLIPLANLVSMSDIVRFLLDPELAASKKQSHTDPMRELLPGFQQFIAPYLGEEDLATLRQAVKPQLANAQWPAGTYARPPAVFHLAAFAGCHDELRAVVESWPDEFYVENAYADYYHDPLGIIFGLGDPRLVEQQTRRLQLRLKGPHQVKSWLAHTEFSAMDVVRDSILAETNRDQAAALMKEFSRVKAPEAAPHILELLLSSKAQKGARAWLESNPEHAIAGLIPVAAGRGKLADAAVDLLRGFKRKGFEALLQNLVAGSPEGLQERVATSVLDYVEQTYSAFDDASTPDWLRETMRQDGAPRKKGRSWVSPDDLPPVVIGDRMLSVEQMEALLSSLRASTLDNPAPMVRAIKEHAAPAALDAFSWRLFELWLMEGAVSGEKWAMLAVGLLGGDACALRLTPLIRVWPGESQHQRAVVGLECLRAIGTDTALMQINGVAQKLKFKGLRTKASECMEEIAKHRGMTRAELEDRIVPDCDLDERGSRSFDFGSRSFRFVLTGDMKPMVRDESGAIKPNLPKPGARDDAGKAQTAVSEWKLLKKQISEVAKIQAFRLEQAMVTGRRWGSDDFTRLLVRHPLMTNLTRLLVWATYDMSGRPASTFRVTEDFTLADELDETLQLPSNASVGLVHPMQLSSELLSTWGELLSDYEIVPPFAQLGRPIYKLQPEEQPLTEIKRFASIKLPPQSLVFTLEKLGWSRGIPQDAGVFYEHSKPFFGAGITAVVNYPGVPVGYMEGWDDQTIDTCYFIPQLYSPEIYSEHTKKMVLRDVDPIVASEVLADLTAIASKGK